MRSSKTLLISAGVMTALSVYLIYKGSLLIGYCSLLLFGGGFVLFVFQLIRGKEIAVPQSKRSSDWQNEHGIFEYTEEGFIVDLHGSKHAFAWTQVNTLFAYKLDLFTVDTIVLDVFCSDNYGFSSPKEANKHYLPLTNPGILTLLCRHLQRDLLWFTTR